MRIYSVITGGLLVWIFLASLNCNDIVKSNPTGPVSPSFLSLQHNWADSVINTLSLEQQIGQLFMVAAYSNGDEAHFKALEKLVVESEIGGLICMQGGPIRQINMVNRLQSAASVPLLLSMDAEWGLAMRLDSTISYPRQMALGAIQDISLIEKMGEQIAAQMNRCGMQLSFSPVADVNNNPANPVINSRSFGEDKDAVSQRSLAYMYGLSNGNVLACGKHFPGHGDTDTDSHKALPVIVHNTTRLDTLELYPFRKLIAAGLPSVMVAHLQIPALDSNENTPSTLSKAIVQDLLKNQMAFKGLVITDALNMQGIAKYYEAGEMDALALMAGNDILLFPGDVPKAKEVILQAINDSLISADDIRERCYKILKAKEWTGLNNDQYLDSTGLYEDLHKPEYLDLNRKLVEASITLLENNKVLPLQADTNNRLAVISIGAASDNSFNQTLSRHLAFTSFTLDKDLDNAGDTVLEKELEDYKTIVINLLGTSQMSRRKFGVSPESLAFVDKLSKSHTVVLNLMGNPYALQDVPHLNNLGALLIGYQDSDLVLQAMAEVVAGASGVSGKLPVSISEVYPAGSGLVIEERSRIKYANALYTGVADSMFADIDSLALFAIASRATPGCQIAVLKDGIMVYNKQFGHFTYDSLASSVTANTLYDLASITKIAASTLAIMKLQEEQKIDVTRNLCDYLALEDSSCYYNLNLQEILSHYARLKSWIAFYSETLEDGVLSPEIYSHIQKPGYSIEVSKDLYINDHYADSIKQQILRTPLADKKEYRYSDLGYYFLKDLIEKAAEMPLPDYCQQSFYGPLHLTNTTFLPLEKFPLSQIAPTENDKTFRKQLIQGYVHDPGAAMMGGVGGHAGLFSTADDLAVLMQMLLNGGYYGGHQYLQPETIDYFTRCHYCEENNRRGIGFDKPSLTLGTGSSCDGASPESYGHSGFTGTLVWADPKYQLVYVFLSNRVYPNAENKTLLNLNIRTNIQQVVYDAYGIAPRAENFGGTK